MLHILLLILKIIGITLGILIGIVLIGICLALFVPLRYQVDARRIEGEGNPPIEVVAKLTWLLHFINVKFSYASELRLRVRVLFFTIFRMPVKPKRNKKKAKRKKKAGRKDKNRKDENRKNKNHKDIESAESQSKLSEKNNTEPQSKAGENSNNIEVEYKVSNEDKADNKDKVDNGKDKKPSDEPNNVSDSNSAPIGQFGGNEKKNRRKFSIKDKLVKICGFFKNIRYTIKKICDRIKEIFENIGYYLDILKSDIFKSSFELCKGELGAVFSYIKPRKFKTNLVIGTGDPASTGSVLAYYYAILYPLLGSDAVVVGDFDNKRIEGTVFIKGKVKLFTLLKAVIRIYFSKDIKNLLKLFNKEDE